jgi:PIN domain-containing protein
VRAIYAPDTNFFLQCKDPEQIDWSLISDAPSVLIVVLREVQKEIDQLKSAGNMRRAARARKMSGVLRDLISSRAPEKPIAPNISISLAPRTSPTQTRHDLLDPSSADDRVVAESMACSREFYDGNLVLLTHDMYPLSIALDVGQAAVPIPDSWLLPPEPDEQSKVIARLQERVSALEGRHPEIGIQILGPDGNPLTRIEAAMPYYAPLSDAFIDGAMKAVAARHPEHVSSANPLLRAAAEVDPFKSWREPSEREVLEYGKAYRGWMEDIREGLLNLADRLNEEREGFLLSVTLTNTGTSAADRMVIDLAFVGSIYAPAPLDDEDDDNSDEGAFQLPPAPPRGHMVSILDGMRSAYMGPLDYGQDFNKYSMPTPRIARDRHSFYWDYDEPEKESKHWRGECEDFRHGLQQEKIAVELKCETEHLKQNAEGAIKLIISARNIAQPVSMTVPVRFVSEPLDPEIEARNLLLAAVDVTLAESSSGSA